ncbi:hypothetical protein K1F50_04600 [Muricauda oceani]|uniref:Uncharacterized protein n=1 Tax=Flagellimonas oceani TaxID=2698672 RepID=A0A6G7J825_9FLAO|nr:hypothetical protein [Allomuricauda oceani]MBW8242068.1 hypothetical protein [Allomuricauda oceani]QII46976.1 hypothetical protein GVT53_20585 [Allomuricauda oceani]
MKKNMFYPTIWSTAPYTPNVIADWDGSDSKITELILKNEAATSLNVSEMHLNITKFSAVDEQGNEHFIIDFPGQNPVTLKGIASGNFIRSKSVLSLPEGKYVALRFYMAEWGNQFVYHDGLTESANSFNRLDFPIEDGFKVEKNNAPEVKLWFDFAPYQWKRHFKPLTDLFMGSKSQKPRLANSFGH